MCRIGKSIETQCRFVVARGQGWSTGEWGVTARGYSFLGDGNVLKLGGGGSCTTVNILKATDLH